MLRGGMKCLMACLSVALALPAGHARSMTEVVMRRWWRSLAITLCVLASTGAWAAFHLFRIEQIYSNADGSVQFIVLREGGGFNGEHFWAGNSLTFTRAGATKSFMFPSNLPSSATAGRRVLIATEGFAALGIVTPNYVIPNGFLATDGGTVNYAGVDFITYATLPTDGVHAIDRSGTVIPNVATNFAGVSASVASPPTVPPTVLNFQGLWYNAPAESESGWGINLAHQGDVIFVTWFTYDVNGKAWWLTMTAEKTAEKVYTGTLLETRGPAFNAVPFSPTAVTRNTVGSGTLTFIDANNGSFTYTVNGITQTKTIVRQVFGPLPTCVWPAPSSLAVATNFQDLWYAAPAESESGWGVNFTHQGGNIFATWFTYDFNGAPLWLSATAAKSAVNVYSGALVGTTGPAFSAVPFLPANVSRTEVGMLTITFAGGSAANYTYTVTLPGQLPVTQTKSITRQVFRAPGTLCQ